MTHTLSRGSLFGAAEKSSTRILEFQPVYLLSLLRTRRYAALDRRGPESDGQLDARMARQKILDRPNSEFEFIMTEAALYWAVGRPEVMVEQIEHLLNIAATNERVTLGFIPTGRFVDFFIGHAFHIYDNKEVIVGTRSSTERFIDVQTVADFVDLFGLLRKAAVFEDDARRILIQALDHYRSLT